MSVSRSLALFVSSVVVSLGCSSSGSSTLAPPATATPAAAAPAAEQHAAVASAPVLSAETDLPVAPELGDDDRELDAEPELVATERHAPVIHEGGARVVLSSRADEAWAIGAAELISDGSPVVVRRDVDFAQLPEELRARVGTSVRLVGIGASSCTATLGKLSIIARTEPHFGVRQSWSGDPANQEPPSTIEQIAEQGWTLSEGGRVLVADVVPTEGNCDGSYWARSASLDMPAVTPARIPYPRLHARALAEFRALPRYLEIQQQLREHEPDHGSTPWDEFDGSRPMLSMIHPVGRATALLFVSAKAGVGCGGFFGGMSAVFEVTDPQSFPQLSLVTDSMPSDVFAPSLPAAAADLDGDGTLELLVHEGLITDLGRQTKRHALEVPFLDCPC